MTQPPAEVELSLPLLRRLLEAQHPDLADEPLRIAGEGWDHLMVRVGDELVARLPRREVAVELHRNEVAWLPRIAEVFPFPVPVPVRTGRSGEGYPWPWSLVPWIPGQTVERQRLEPASLAALGTALRGLHACRLEAPANPFRQVALADRTDRMEEALGSMESHPAVRPEALRRLWSQALATGTPPHRSWIHGDLHGLNVVGAEGRITGVIDWGDFTSGDPATDLAAAWLVARGREGRRAFLEAYEPDPGTLARARGWAVLIGLLLLGSGDEAHETLGEAVLSELVEDARPLRPPYAPLSPEEGA